MRMAPVVTQLQNNTTLLKDIGGAAEFAAIENLQRLPAAYVIPAQETASRNTLSSNAVHQRITSGFSVVIVVSNKRDAVGGAANEDLDSIITEVRAALLGWQHADADIGTTYAGGGLLGMADGMVIWSEQFSTEYSLRAT